jgi:DNA-binding MarR family transcriptional regulator
MRKTQRSGDTKRRPFFSDAGPRRPAKSTILPGDHVAENKVPDDTTRVWSRPGFLVRRLHQISVAIFMDETAGLGITPVQFGALSILAASPGLDQSTLGAELGIDRANIADVIARLSTGGYVTRHNSQSDRRVKNIYITEAGTALLHEANARFRNVQSRLLGPLTPQDRATFITLTMQLIETNNSLGRAVLRLKRPLQKSE